MLLLRGKTKVAQMTGEELSEAMNSLYASISEHLGAMKTAKGYGAEGRHAEIFGRLTEQVSYIYTRAIRNQAETNYWFQVGSVLILSLILYVSLGVLAIPTAGVLMLLFLFARIIPKFATIQQNYQSLVNMMPSFTRVMEMQHRCEKAAEPRPERREEIELRQALCFEKVSFTYDPGRGPAIHPWTWSSVPGRPRPSWAPRVLERAPSPILSWGSSSRTRGASSSTEGAECCAREGLEGSDRICAPRDVPVS